MTLEEKIREAMIYYGAIAENWRIKIIAIERVGSKNSDYANVIIKSYKHRSKKPDYVHTLYIDTVRELIFWDRSNCEKLK